jgi:hypothetical protein
MIIVKNSIKTVSANVWRHIDSLSFRCVSMVRGMQIKSTYISLQYCRMYKRTNSRINEIIYPGNDSTWCKSSMYTRDNAQVVTNLQQTCSNAVPTTCQQYACSQLVDNLLQGCWAQQTCRKLFQQLVIILQFNNLSTSCEWQPCSNLIK